MEVKRDMSVVLSGVRLDNPVIPASGCFGYGYGMAEFYDIDILGSISFKGTTREARYGNPLPRVAECREGMINAVAKQKNAKCATAVQNLKLLNQNKHYRFYQLFSFMP